MLGKREIDKQRPPDYILGWHETPVATVLAVGRVVAHGEKIPRRHSQRLTGREQSHGDVARIFSEPARVGIKSGGTRDRGVIPYDTRALHFQRIAGHPDKTLHEILVAVVLHQWCDVAGPKYKPAPDRRLHEMIAEAVDEKLIPRQFVER